MKQAIGYVALVVQDYDEAIKFYVDTLGFRLIEDTVIAAFRGADGCSGSTARVSTSGRIKRSWRFLNSL